MCKYSPFHDQFISPPPAGNTTFLFETPTSRGDFNNHPDLETRTVLVTFNQSSYRYFADKKLYVRYNLFQQYKRDMEDRNTNHAYFFMFTPLVKGPYGLPPILNVGIFNNEMVEHAGNRSLVLGWTSLLPDDERAPLGYTAEMVREMSAAIKASKYTFRILEFDAVHASWSNLLLDDLFNVTKYVMFFSSEDTLQVAEDVNVPALNRMVKQCGLNRTFLKVHESIRDFIIPPPPTRKRRTRFFLRNLATNLKSTWFSFVLWTSVFRW